MHRETLYVIGKRTFEKQQVGKQCYIQLTDDETDVGDGNFGRFYAVLFGKDAKGVRYMVLALQETGVGEWHGAYKSGGHWHGSGFNHFVKGYAIKLRKNFKSADEANDYYKIVYKMTNWTVQQENKYTEAQIDKLFK